MGTQEQEIFGRIGSLIDLLQKDKNGEFTGKRFKGRLLKPIQKNCLVSFLHQDKLSTRSILPGNMVTELPRGKNGKIEIITRDGFTYVQSEN